MDKHRIYRWYSNWHHVFQYDEISWDTMRLMLIFQICLRHRDMSTLRHVARFVRPYRRLCPYRAPTNWWPSPHRLSSRSLGAQRKPQNRWKTWCYRMLSLSWNIILLGCDQLLIFSEFARNRFMSVVPFLGNFEWSRRQLRKCCSVLKVKTHRPTRSGWWARATPLKNMNVSWDDYSQYMGK